MHTVLKKIFAHKLLLTIIVLGLAGGGYFAFQQLQGTTVTPVTYTTAAVERGNLIVSVTGTGQVSVSDQIDIKPEASGSIVSLPVQKGDTVKTGALIAQIDNSSALQSLRDAETNLESAKLSLKKLQQPADTLTLVKAQNTLTKAQEAKPDAEADLAKSYEDGFNGVADAFLDLPTVMAGLDAVLFGSDLSAGQSGQWNVDYYETRAKQYEEEWLVDQYVAKALASYKTARASYDGSFQSYKNTSRSADDETIETLIKQTYATVRDVSEAIKDVKNLIDFFEDTLTKKDVSIPTVTATHQSDLKSYTGTISGHLSGLFSDTATIDDAKAAIVNAERSIVEAQESLADLQAGTDPLDLESQQLTIQQRENAILDARQALADYYVRAPFDGVIAELNIRKGESVSSGTSIATLITTQKIAEITLNEIDAAQITLGQKATLMFDAVPELSITGDVVDIDAVGTVSSGVVSYGVKIAFDVQDDRVKPGMSLSVAIITESKQNVLLVPTSAVKTSAGSSFVEILVNGAPQRTAVTVGSSSDTMIEITDGLAEGDLVVTQTVSSANATQTSGTGTGQQGDAMRGVFQMVR